MNGETRHCRYCGKPTHQYPLPPAVKVLVAPGFSIATATGEHATRQLWYCLGCRCVNAEWYMREPQPVNLREILKEAGDIPP